MPTAAIAEDVRRDDRVVRTIARLGSHESDGGTNLRHLSDYLDDVHGLFYRDVFLPIPTPILETSALRPPRSDANLDVGQVITFAHMAL